MRDAWVQALASEDLLLLGAPISIMDDEHGPYVHHFVKDRGLDEDQIAASVGSEWSKLVSYKRLKALQVYLFQDALKDKVITLNRFDALRLYASHRDLNDFFETSDLTIIDGEGTKMSNKAVNAALEEEAEVA